MVEVEVGRSKSESEWESNVRAESSQVQPSQSRSVSGQKKSKRRIHIQEVVSSKEVSPCHSMATRSLRSPTSRDLEDGLSSGEGDGEGGTDIAQPSVALDGITTTIKALVVASEIPAARAVGSDVGGR